MMSFRSPDLSTKPASFRLPWSTRSAAPRWTEIAWTDLEVGDTLGTGSFGSVFRGKYRRGDVAIKVLHPGSAVEAASLQLEIAVLEKLRFMHIITAWGAATSDPARMCIVLELATHGSLHTRLHVDHSALSPHDTATYAMQIGSGLEYIHAHGVVHRDLKSHNILLVGRVCKLADFGLAQVKTTTRASTRHGGSAMMGTLPWMAPELYDDELTEATIDWFKVDVYAYAMVVYELLARRLPFANLTNPMQFLRALEKGSRPELSAPAPLILKPLDVLMRSLWATDPRSRPAVDRTLVERIEAIVDACALASGNVAHNGGDTNADGAKTLPAGGRSWRVSSNSSTPRTMPAIRASPRNWFARRREAAAARTLAKRNAVTRTVARDAADEADEALAVNATSRAAAKREAALAAIMEELAEAKALEEAASTRREAAEARENAARHEREAAAIARKVWLNSVAAGACGAVVTLVSAVGDATMALASAVGGAAFALGSCMWGAAKCCAASSSRELRKGVRVRVKRSVAKPRYGWADKMTHDSIGIVRSFDSDGDPRVDFPDQKNWVIERSEVEVVASPFFCCAPAVSCLCLGGEKTTCWPSRSIRKGAYVRVKRSIVEPQYGWGEVSHSSIGVVKRVDDDGDVRVEFPEQSGWTALASELEVVGCVPIASCLRFGGGKTTCWRWRQIREGARVRVKRSVAKPRYGWGGVDHESIGVVKLVDDDGKARVDFPEHSNWACLISELEVVSSGEKGKTGATGAAPQVEKDEPGAHTVEQALPHRTAKGDKDKADAAETQALQRGARVRVKRSIVTPRYEWGEVSHESIGILTRVDDDGKARVDFPEQSGWMALVSELETAPPGEEGTGEKGKSGVTDKQALQRGARVRVKRSVAKPRYGWGEVSHESIGVVKLVDDDGDVRVDFPEHSGWAAMASELETVPPGEEGTGEKGKSGAAYKQALQRGARVRVKRSVAKPRYGWGEVSHESIGVVKRVDDDGKIRVDFPDQSNWAAMASELDIVDMARAESDEVAAATIKPGARVRFKATVSTPRYGWAGVKPGSIGIVADVEDDGDARVTFPEQSLITFAAELETVSDDAAAADSDSDSESAVKSDDD